MHQAAQLHPGYILHQRAYRDTSLLLEVFTREHGRFGLVARGARGPKSRIRGLLQPFQPLLLSWSGRGELGTLSGVEAAVESGRGVSRLTGAALYSGFYLNELLLRLLPRQDSHPFEKQLLDALGYGLLLDHEADSGEPVCAEAEYVYALESGPRRCESAEARGLKLSGRSLLSLAAEDLADAQSLAESKRLLRAALELYLGGRELKTREVFAAITGR